MNVPNRALALLLGGTLAAGCGGRGTLAEGDARDASDARGRAGADGAAGRDAPTAKDAHDAAAVDLRADVLSSGDALYPVDGRCAARGSYPTPEGPCRCQPSIPVACPNPCADAMAGLPGCPLIDQPLICVDTRSDPDHCGACGATCTTTAVCRDGACGPIPTRVVGPTNGCTGLSVAVGGGKLYWADAAHGTVSAMPTAGGAVSTVATDQLDPTWLRIHGDSLYWIARGAQTLMKAPLAGGAPALVVKSPNAGAPPTTYPGINGYTVAPDGTPYISSGARIYEVAVGGAPRMVVDQIQGGFPTGLGLDGNKIVFVLNFSGHLEATPLPPAGAPAVRCGLTNDGDAFFDPCRFVFTHGVVADGLFVKSGHAYFPDTVGNGVYVFEIKPDVVRNDQIGTLDAPPEWFGTLTLEGDQAFFLAGGYVVQTSLVPDSRGMLLVRNQAIAPVFSTIAADATNVYWTTWEGPENARACSIFRVARQ